MEQTKALNALEPFLALSKSATSPHAAADLVTRATSHSATFIFAELLSTPQIHSLSAADDEQLRSHLDLLRVFSHGTLQSYRAHPTPLPPLNEAQILKLRQLSLLSLASDRSSTPDGLSYDGLMAALDLADARAVEDVVVSAIYAGLISGTLDPHRRCVMVDTVAPLRDLAPGEIPPTVDALRAWSGRCTDALSAVNARIHEIRSGAAARQRAERESRDRMDSLIKTANEQDIERERKAPPAPREQTRQAVIKPGGLRAAKRSSRGLSRNDRGDEPMDVDDDMDRGERKRAT